MRKYDPDPHYLSSKIVENLGWHDTLAELIDNAFDANANRVELALASKSLVVSDDGDGCADLTAMARLGVHKRHSATSLGMHGRGMKDAWFYLGDRICIKSARGGMLHQLDLSVEELIRNDWNGPDPTSTKTTERGTIVTFPDIRRTQPKQKTWAALSKTFMPALNDGRQIVVKTGNKRRHRVKAFVPPPTVESVVGSFEVDGKSVDINIGIIPEGEKNTTTGFLFTYGHRTIMESALGAGECSCTRLAGVVRLGKGWKLAPHKTELGEEVDALGEAIFSRINTIAEKAHQQSQIAESNAFKLELEGTFRQGLKTLREKRNSNGDASGTVLPVKSGRKRKKAHQTSDQPGGVDADGNKSSKSGFSIDLASLGNDAPVGKADTITNRVTLNSDHPFIEANWNQNAPAITAVAMAIFTHSRCNGDGHSAFLFEKYDFTDAWSAMLESWKGTNGHEKA